MKNKPSQDLSEAKQQELQTLQLSIQTAEKQWQAQKLEIAKDTQVTIETSKLAIAEAIKDAKAELSDAKVKAKETKDTIDGLEAVKKAEESRINAEIAILQHEQKVLTKTNFTLLAENNTLKSEIAVNREELQSLNTQQDTIMEHIGDMTEQELSQSATLAQLNDDVESTTKQLDTLATEFATKKAQCEQELVVLEARKKAQTQEIIENRAQDDKVRENLADWERKLQERDQNVRIREARANEQEQSIIRNYNLLNI